GHRLRVGDVLLRRVRVHADVHGARHPPRGRRVGAHRGPGATSPARGSAVGCGGPGPGMSATMSVVIPAHDEASIIADRLRLLVESDVRGELEIVVVAIGCTD